MSAMSGIIRKSDYVMGFVAATKALEHQREMIELYATHKSQECDENQGRCNCGLYTFLLIGESKLEDFKMQLERVTEKRNMDLDENTAIVPKYMKVKQ